MEDYITRREAIAAVCRARLPDTTEDGIPIANGKRSVTDCVRRLKEIPAADVRPVPDGGIGEMSDGYHTFNGLYYQRMVLFAALVKAHKDKAWKSWRHEDGELCFGGGWFIVGIDTPEGSYTYHYEEKDWNRFECEELPVAKHWDGHTEKDVTRLLSLDVRPVVLCSDCVHFHQFRPHDGFCEIDDMLCDNNFFCANGKKEES
jgi:hypothetical protein